MLIMLICGKDSYSQYAKKILEGYLDRDSFVVIEGNEGDYFDEEIIYYHPTYIICFNSPWALSGKIIASAQTDCICIQSGTKECFGKYSARLALFYRMTNFGAVAYSLKENHNIYAMHAFRIGKSETVCSLKTKSSAFQLTIFTDIIEKIAMHEAFSCVGRLSPDKECDLYALENIAEISTDFSREKIENIMQTCKDTGVKPYTVINGERYTISKS